MDGQGAERARPYLEAAGATYPAVVDADGVTGRLYGFKAVSSGFLIDERGNLAFSKINGFSIHRPELADLVSRWAAESEVPPFEETDDLYLQIQRGATDRRAIEIYRRGVAKYREGDRPGAAALMREAHAPRPRQYHRPPPCVGNREPGALLRRRHRPGVEAGAAP